MIMEKEERKRKYSSNTFPGNVRFIRKDDKTSSASVFFHS